MARVYYKSSDRTTRSVVSKEEMTRLIQKKAYELYEKRGKKTGRAIDDWLEAERLVKADLAKQG